MGKKRQEKSGTICRTSSEAFSPHNNDQDQEVQQDLATPIQSQERLKAFNLKEIKDEMKMLKKRHQVSTLLLPEY
jgi:hypothetical protein